MMFDSNFNFSNHVSQVIKSTRVHARDLCRIRPLLDINTSVLLANALVSSRLDYNGGHNIFAFSAVPLGFQTF